MELALAREAAEKHTMANQLDGEKGAAQTLTEHIDAVIPCSPRFGVGHALCLGLAPWLAAEIPYLVDGGVIQAKK